MLFIGQFLTELYISAPVIYLLLIFFGYDSTAVTNWPSKHFCRNTGVFTAKTFHALEILREAFRKGRMPVNALPSYIINFFDRIFKR